MDSSRPSRTTSLSSFLQLSIAFGIGTGLVEGFGLLLFQHLNWRNWGRMIHVSSEILWISPVVDLFLFGAVGLMGFMVARAVPRLPAVRAFVFVCVGLTIYDWLTVTDRLWHFSCLLLAIGGAATFDRRFVRHQDQVTHFWRRTTPWLSVLLALIFVVIEGGGRWGEREAVANLPSPASGSPNVLVVVLDALRADHVSAYGYPRATTPEIDRLAAEGVLFENAIATASWSLPSHASLVTGRYPFEHGAEDIRDEPWWGTHPSGFSGYPTLGEALQKRGYRTGAFSGNRVYFTHDSGFQRAFLHFEDYFYSPRDAGLRTLYGREFLRLYLSRRRHFVLHKRADVVNDELLRWLDRDRERPFFAFLNYFDVHDPYGGPPKYPKPSWELESPIDNYDAGLKYDDDLLANLLAELARRGLAKNTIVVVTSDHGESLGQHNLLTHSRALYWELVHVPLVIWYPGHVPANTRVPRPVSGAAIASTVIDLIDPGTVGEFPGPPLTRLWTSPAAAADWPFPLSEIARNAYPEATEKLADQAEPTSSTGWMKSMVTPKWHLILHEHLGTQLYEWGRDAEEKNNLNGTQEGGATISELTSSLRSIMGKSAPPGFRSAAAPALSLHDGTFDFDPGETSAAPADVSDYYRVTVAPGSNLTVQVATRGLTPASQLDPVVAIQDTQGNTLRTCRNPGDDHLHAPGRADPTPDAFDDLCLNDDAQSGQRDARLEFSVPASEGPSFELYVHVLSWNPKISGSRNYRLILSGTK